MCNFFKGLGKVYLTFVNVIAFILGVAMLGFGAYGYTKLGPLPAEITSNGMIVTMVAGGFTLLVGLIGCLGASKQNKCLLFIYSTLMFVLFVVYLAGGFVVLVQTNTIQKIVNTAEIKEVQETANQGILDAMLASADLCCDNLNVEQCTGDSPNYKNCYVNNDLWNVVYTPLNESKTEYCQILGEIPVGSGSSSFKLVGTDTSTGSCGGSANSVPAFVNNFGTVLNQYFHIFVITSIVVGVFLALCLLFSCCLLCANREEYDEEYRKRMEAQRRAGDISGTGGPAYGSVNKQQNYV